MKSPIVVTRIRSTTSACPAQWEGLTNEGLAIFARHRWGHLSIRLAEQNTDSFGQTIFEAEHGGPLSGDLDFETLKKLTSGSITWPEHES